MSLPLRGNMDEVDQELFLEMLLKLDGSHESIKAASKWCRANAQYHQDVVRMWFFAIVKARTMVRRLDLFHLASDILFTAEAQSINYFSSFLPQLVKAVSLVRGEGIKLSMKKLFSLWREKNIYNKPVMDRLGKLLRNRNKVVDMNIYRYDRELLFKNLQRVQDLKPACDYLMKGMEHTPSFDDSQRLLSTIKERRACNSLLTVVDNHKTKVTSLVSYLEEMVHLLKMATAALDIAANREQNGIEETKLKIMAYGRYNEKVLSLLHRLESNYNISKKDAIIPLTPASPDPEGTTTLFSRRVDPSFSDSPASPVNTWSSQTTGGFSGTVAEPTIFHRRESYMAPSNFGSRTPTRDPYPSSLSSMTASREPYPSNIGSITPTRDPYPTNPGSNTPSRDPYPANRGSMTPTRDPYPSNLGSLTPSRDPYPSNRGSMTPTRDPYQSNLPLITPTREPFPSTSLGAVTPTRDETTWYPANPSFSGTSPWGAPAQSFNTGRAPVYQTWYTGINQGTDTSLKPNAPSSSFPSLLSLPFTTFMGPSSSGYRKQ